MRRWFSVLVVVGVLSGATAGAQQAFEAFGSRRPASLVVPAFGNEEVAGLLATLDRLLGRTPGNQSGPAAWNESAPTVLWQFARRLQNGRLSRVQERTVLDHLDRIATDGPVAAAAVSAPRRMIAELTVGKKAPNIIGTDLDGRALTLADYRNKVVVLVFSAEWCAICRTQAPYERFLLERYNKNWPFALLGVQTASSREAARLGHVAQPLSHRSWWDAPSPGATGGPIASAWNVVGWPASYVIDGDGVIRFVDLRDEDLLKAVRQLVDAQVDRDAKAPRVK